jgi:hypothetical protein
MIVPDSVGRIVAEGFRPMDWKTMLHLKHPRLEMPEIILAGPERSERKGEGDEGHPSHGEEGRQVARPGGSCLRGFPWMD